ncbi:hypothetical protein PIB30_013683 [Stylosanthes scabra]|uniref:GDSL esterase/lipase n=1 Tax=Stylosanthes scabra TaxID=79078 RepID=A0ABU6W7L0_9FABA|nr:hypothetical protein [Stylosanthes scabra]
MVANMFRIATAGANGKYPALFAFGDSILDTGNNNNLQTLTKSNFPPNGRNFIGGQPTGRFSDGKVLSDVIAGALGIKETLPAYLDPNLRNEELSTGVCFASLQLAQETMISPQIYRSGVLQQGAQLQNFREYITRLKAVVGEERANNITSNALYLISAGNNDIAITYSSTIKRNMPFPLYAWRTAGGGPLRLCAENANEQAQLFNARLASTVTFCNALFLHLPFNSLMSILHSLISYKILQLQGFLMWQTDVVGKDKLRWQPPVPYLLVLVQILNHTFSGTLVIQLKERMRL